MAWKMCYFYFLTCFLCFFARVLALELKSVRPHEWKGQNRRALIEARDTSALDLQSYETFLWEAPDGADLVLGNFTVYTPGGSENILSLEKFEPMVKSVDCTPKGMTLKFIDDGTFAYAQQVWDWVNGDDNNTFVMVAGAGDCGTNAHRIPYLISTIQYDEAANIARLKGKTDKWKNIVHAYELHVGKAPMPPERKIKVRDVDDSSAFSVAKAFPFKVKVEVATLLGELECEDCGLGGNLDVDMHINYGLPDIIDAAVFRMTPQNIIAQAHPKLTIGSQKKAEGKWDKDLLPQPIPLYAITLGGFVRLGVFTDVKLGFEAAVEGTLSFTSGAKATIPNSAFVEVDFKNLGSGPKSSPWTPDVDMAPLEVSGQAAGTFQLFIMPELKLEASALEFGYEADLGIKAPFFEAKVELEADGSGGVCDDAQTTLGLNVKGSVGAELRFTAGQLHGKHDIDLSIATLPLLETPPVCIPLEDSEVPAPTGAKPSASSVKPKPTANPPPASTPRCTSNSGDSGSCISTTSCKNLGGISEAGHCPGGTSIQCCTFPEGSGDTCTANGITGTCMPTSSCPSDTGVSIAGECRGPTDVQCCVSKENAESVSQANVCTIDKAGLKNSGFVGECISTTNCRRMGGTSTPGFCKGGTDVQCCTYGKCSDGLTGVCEPTSTCTGTTTAGHCGGGKNIQCCSQNFDASHPGIER